jgi:hypothetical protein
VRIALDLVPANVRLVAGQTATVKVVPAATPTRTPAAPARAVASAPATTPTLKQRS